MFRDRRIKNQQVFIHKCQLPSGTFRLSPDSEVINPYFTNLGLLALTEIGDCEPVKQHLLWYLKHVSPNGYVNDYRYRYPHEIDTGTADSEDSYHATFFSLLYEYIKQSEDLHWFMAIRDQLASILQSLCKLQCPDGLTWAKHSYKVKYLMDNCEVYQGLIDASQLFHLMNDRKNAHLAEQCALACKQGINRTYKEKTNSFAIYGSTYPTWTKWYPDATSQAFPLVYEIIESSSSQAISLYNKIIGGFPHFELFEIKDSYPWMIMGLCAHVMNDRDRVKRMTQAADNLYINGPRQNYWVLHEAGRYIQLVLRQ
ncbi:hypothetical protein [Brevibacillus sp. SYSU BS000544]|uniref:hypothetical protein n=1 Tax=Brevibacillus sp. SYSU BS000544 TaxID=3416443 RepID=UPI003CE4C98D